jgi:DNA-binding response OmpR family regulator
MSAGATILIVEDDRLNVRLLTEICHNAGYETRVAMDGETGLEMAEEIRPDLILLDLMLPRLDGFGVLTRLRADPLLADTPVIVVTAIQDTDARTRAVELGADDFLNKPFKLYDLQTRVRSALQLRQFRRQLQRDMTPATRDRRSGAADEADRLDRTVDSLRVGGGPVTVGTFRFEGRGAPDVVEAVLAAARDRVPGGKANLFTRGERRHSFVVAAEMDAARKLVATLERIAEEARERAMSEGPTLVFGLGRDRDAADAACASGA